jgi:ABC-type glycerol-3-phosphate transport system permease component
MAEPLDLRKLQTDEALSMGSDDGPPWTPVWAGIARPFAYFILFLVAAVISVPFLALFVQALRSQQDAARETINGQIVDWAKTVLAPVIGFGSAVIGYYFGARNGAAETPPSPASSSSDPRP